MKSEYVGYIADSFLKHKVMDMASIQTLFPSRSRSSIIRDLKTLQYITSYNRAGSYYTLLGIPSFDDDGIWRHKEAYFSSQGSLKNTVKGMVASSPDGRTHDELRQRLGVRVQNTLLDLVNGGTIAREKYENTYLYVSAESGVRRRQLDKRSDSAAIQADPYTTIEVLRTVIKHPGVNAAAAHSILSKEGSGISASQVEAVFGAYDLEKKTLLTAD